MPRNIDEKTPLIAKDAGQLVRHVPIEEGYHPDFSESSLSRCWSSLSKMTVEPYVALECFAVGIENVFLTNLWVDKVCYHAYNNSEICDNLDTKYPAQQDIVQRKVSEFNFYGNICQYLPGIFVLMFLGSWGDNKDRKFPVIVPLVGFFLKAVVLLANSYWFHLPSAYILLGNLLFGLSGGDEGFYMTTYAYVSNISDGRSRTTRFAIINFLYFLFATGGAYAGDILFQRFGYVGVFSVFTCFTAAAIIYAVMRLDSYSSSTTGGSIWVIFALKNLKKTAMVIFKKRKDDGRGILAATFFSTYLLVFNYGTRQLDFLYTRKSFSWSYDTFTKWYVVDTPLSALGLIVVLPILSYRFKMEDPLVAFIGGISMLFYLILKGTAPFPWILYLSSVIGLPSSIMVSALRAFVSKLVEEEELGSVFAVMGLIETVVLIMSSVVFMAVYNSTIEFFPGAIYILGAANVLVVMILQVWMMTRRTSQESKVNKEGGKTALKESLN